MWINYFSQKSFGQVDASAYTIYNAILVPIYKLPEVSFLKKKYSFLIVCRLLK